MNMTQTYYLRLKLVADKQTELPTADDAINYYKQFESKWTYKLIIKPKRAGLLANGKTEKTETGRFTLLRSKEHEFVAKGYTVDELNQLFTVTWEIYYDKKKRYHCAGEFFDHNIASGKHARSGGGSADWSEFSLDFTKSIKEFKEGQTHLVIQQITSGTGWYLVKKPEEFGHLVNRVYISPTDLEWDIMVSNNPHLKNASSRASMLQPGQVVIIAKTKSDKNAKLQQMKQQALQAQKAFEQAQAAGGVDAAFLMLLDLRLQDKKLVTLKDKSFIAEAVGIIDAGKPYVDGTLKFHEEVFHRTGSAHDRVMKAAQAELAKVTTANGMGKRGVSAAGQNASKAYKLMDGAVARKLFEWDTGIQANKASDYIRQEARVRYSNYQNGIANVAEEIGTVGKYRSWLKKGGYVGLAVEVGVGGYKINDAYERGDTKGVITETGQLAGSVGGGAIGGWAGGIAGGAAVAVLGVATGGLGLIVVGIFVAGGAYLGGESGKFVVKEYVTDPINKLID